MTRPSRPVLFALLAIALPMPAAAVTTYHWVGGGDESWPTSTHWSPARSAPAVDDILVFDRGDSIPVFGVPTQTVGQLVVSNGSRVSLQATAASTVSILGDPGTDLVVEAGARLTLQGASAVSLSLGSSATGNVAGAVVVQGGAHRLLSAATDGLAIASGGSVATQAGFTGNVFGTASLNSVRFLNGSLYVSAAGANPFGATQPNSVVRFDHGSRFRLDAGTPATAGRTYADLEDASAAAVTMTAGSGQFVVDSLLVTRGSLALNVPDARIQGAIRVATGATLDFSPGTIGGYALGGSSPQWIRALGSNFNANANVRLIIDNPAHVYVDSTASTTLASLSFSQGCIIMPQRNAYELGTFRCEAQSNGGPATGWVVGRLGLPVGKGQTLDFPVGDAGHSLTMVVHLITRFGPTVDYLYAGTGPVDVPWANDAQLTAGQRIHRTWWLDAGQFGDHSEYDVNLPYLATDVDAGTDLVHAVVRERVNDQYIFGDWRRNYVDSRTATSFHLHDAFSSDSLLFAAGDSALVYVDGGQVVQAEGAGPMTIPFTLSQPCIDDVTFNYGAADSTAQAGSDYGSATGVVVIRPHFTKELGDSVSITIVDDAVHEADESFRVPISNVTGAIPRYRALGTILNDDPSAPPAITLLSPTGGEHFVIGTNSAITWSASDDFGVTGVDVLLSRDGGGNYVPLATGLANTGSWNWTVTGPATSSARVRVVAHDADAQTATDSSPSDFAIDDLVGVEPVVTAFALGRVVPNPAHDAARFIVDLPHEARVRVRVLDVRGRVVATALDRALDAGRHAVAWGAGSAPAGLYFLRMEAAGFTATEQFVVVR